MMQGGIKILISLDLPRGLRAAGALREASRGVPEPPGGARDALVQALPAAGPSALAAQIRRLGREASSPLTPAERNPLPARTHTRGLLSFRRTKRNRSGRHGKKMDLG